MVPSRCKQMMELNKALAGRKEWATIGYAWRRENREGYSVKLNAMPIGNHWNSTSKLLPPYDDDDAGDRAGIVQDSEGPPMRGLSILSLSRRGSCQDGRRAPTVL